MLHDRYKNFSHLMNEIFSERQSNTLCCAL